MTVASMPLLPRSTARHAVRIAGAAALTLFALYVTCWAFLRFNDGVRHVNVSYDEGFFLWCGWCINKGLAPYRDFLEFKPPVIFLTHAFAMKAFGLENFGFRTFFTFFPLASLLAVQLALLSRGADKLLTAALTVGFASLWTSTAFHDSGLADTESIGLAYYLLGVGCLLARLPRSGKGERWLRGLGGFLLACSIFSKEPYLPCIGFTWISAFFLRANPGDPKKDARAYAIDTLGGAGVLLLGLCVYMVPTGAMKAYVAMFRQYTQFYRDPKLSYCVVLGRFTPTTPLNDLLIQWHHARRDFFNAQTLGYLSPFCAAALTLTCRRSPILLGSVLLAGGFALLAVTASNCQWMHYYTMTMSGLFFACIVGVDSLTPHLDAMTRAARGFVVLAVVGVVATHVSTRLEAENLAYGSRAYTSFGSEPIPGLFKTIADHTTPSDRIVTLGAPLLYVQVNRLSAIREAALDDEALGFYNGNTDEERLSGIYAELVQNRPKMVILEAGFGDQRKRRHRKACFEPFLAEYHYREISPRVWLRPD